MTHVLLLEDEDILARNIAEILRRSTIRVSHAASCAQGAALLLSERFDAVLCDISLGDGDGMDLLRRFRDRLGATPVIVLTGQDSLANRSRAEAQMVSAFLAKPFALSRLVELVRVMTRRGIGAARPARGPSVVMYSHDSIGLGHMRRNSAIARELVALVPDVSVLMVMGSPTGMIFDPHPGIDYVKLPSLSKLARGRFEAETLRLDAAATLEIRRGIVERVVETFRPDLFLVDHEPRGVEGELDGVLEHLRRTPTVTVLGLRDILDAPERVMAAWAANGTDRTIAECYDEVLVYGSEAFYPSATHYGLEALRPGRVTSCDVVTAARPMPPRLQGRRRHVVVSGGGGRDAFPLVHAVLGGMEALGRKRPDMTVVTGPLMDGELRDETRRRAAALGIACEERVSDFPALLATADLFVAMTGYNSINEALALQVPVLTLPRLGPSAEQRIRAERLAALGLARVIAREDLAPERMARLLRAPVLPPVGSGWLGFDGARRAAQRLAHLIDLARSAPPPQETTHAI